MQNNPNADLPRRFQDYVAPQSLCVFVLPNVGADQKHFAHETATVLTDLLQPTGDEWGLVEDDDPKSGYVLLVKSTYPAGIQKVNDALHRVAERYGASGIVWNWGPLNRVAGAEYAPAVNHD